MRSVENLARVLQQLMELVLEEAEGNPVFAERVEALLAPLPDVPTRRSSPKGRTDAGVRTAREAPDVFAVYEERGEEEFLFWLREQDLPSLRAVVKMYGFDPGKMSRSWKEPDRYVALIVEQTSARLRRGSAFLSPRPGRPPDETEPST